MIQPRVRGGALLEYTDRPCHSRREVNLPDKYPAEKVVGSGGIRLPPTGRGRTCLFRWLAVMGYHIDYV